MISQRRRNVEVSRRNCNADERTQFEAANDKETDQWISNLVSKSFEEPEYLSHESWPRVG